MTVNNSVNLAIDNNTDGFDLTGGLTPRTFSVSGADISMVGNGANVFTFPSSSATLARIDAGQTFTGNNTFSGLINTPNLIDLYTTTVTATSSTTLTVNSNYYQYFTGTATQTVVMPVATTLTNGQSWLIQNLSTGLVTVQSSGGTTLIILAANTFATITCINTAGGTGAASWNVWYEGDSIASGKKLTVNNSLTLAGTDGTTITFPSSSGTIPLNNQQMFIGTTGVAINRTSAALTLAGITLTTPVIGAATGTSTVLTGAITTSSATSAGLGFATGAGGAITQSTSKVTAFTLSKNCGTIQFAADALASQTSTAGATWTNTCIGANDIIHFTHSSGGTLGAYNISCAPGSGTATIYLRNTTGGSLSEAPIFRFAIIKGVVA